MVDPFGESATRERSRWRSRSEPSSVHEGLLTISGQTNGPSGHERETYRASSRERMFAWDTQTHAVETRIEAVDEAIECACVRVCCSSSRHGKLHPRTACGCQGLVQPGATPGTPFAGGGAVHIRSTVCSGKATHKPWASMGIQTSTGLQEHCWDLLDSDGCYSCPRSSSSCRACLHVRAIQCDVSVKERNGLLQSHCPLHVLTT